MKVEAIEKREDVSPKEGKSKYGDVNFADEKNKKYPLDSETHVRAAWSYINMPKNAAKYSSADVATIKRKIKAAGKKYKIEFSDDGDGDGDGDKKTESSLIVVMGAYSVDLEGQAPSQIVYMPKGRWRINPRVNGQPKEVFVSVDKDSATTLQSALEARLSQPVRPIGGFDHKPGAASFIPKGFLWDEQKGVILNLEWTKAGREAIEGRNYGHLSPTFLLDGERVAGLTSRGEIGSLTNSPAFDDGQYAIDRIAASTDPDSNIDPDDDATRQTTMRIGNKLLELALITAEQGEDEDAICAAIEHLHSDLASVRAENAALVKETSKYRAEAQRVAGNAADAVIEAAIGDGKIPAKDVELISYYRAQLIANPIAAKKAIAAMNSNPALKSLITVKAGDSEGQSSNGRAKAKMMADVTREIMAANPNLTFQEAWQKAKREHKELFVEA